MNILREYFAELNVDLRETAYVISGAKYKWVCPFSVIIRTRNFSLKMKEIWE